MTRIAMMQPYFIPYAGYFRLMAVADVFVASDDLQFPRQGWVHRNRLTHERGGLAWLTLPVKRSPHDMRIKELRFGDNAERIFADSLRRFGLFRTPNGQTEDLIDRMRRFDNPLSLILDLLTAAAARLGLSIPIVLQSELGLPPGLRGAEVIFATCEKLGIRRYVNAPGGAHLYDRADFARRGIELTFLDDYRGSFASILQRLADEPAEVIASELHANARTG